MRFISRRLEKLWNRVDVFWNTFCFNGLNSCFVLSLLSFYNYYLAKSFYACFIYARFYFKDLIFPSIYYNLKTFHETATFSIYDIVYMQLTIIMGGIEYNDCSYFAVSHLAVTSLSTNYFGIVNRTYAGAIINWKYIDICVRIGTQELSCIMQYSSISPPPPLAYPSIPLVLIVYFYRNNNSRYCSTRWIPLFLLRCAAARNRIKQTYRTKETHIEREELSRKRRWEQG